MEASHRRSRHARLATAGVLAAGLLLLTAGAASAQIGEDLLPPLDETVAETTDTLDDTIDGITGDVDEIEDDLDETVDDTAGTLEDTVDDTTGTIGDTIDGLTGGEDGSGDDGEPEPTGPGGGGGEGGGGSSEPDGRESSTTSGETTGEAGTPSGGGGSTLDGDDQMPIGAVGSSGSVAARAVIAAVTRAARLVWPLAPPLILAGIALLGLAGMGRGSVRLLKVDPLGQPTRRFRL